jgi:hypothetical protein
MDLPTREDWQALGIGLVATLVLVWVTLDLLAHVIARRLGFP